MPDSHAKNRPALGRTSETSCAKRQIEEPLAVVARSRRDMLDAVRQALSGASRQLGGLERCDARIVPQVLTDGKQDQFQIMVSVTKRGGSAQRGS